MTATSSRVYWALSVCLLLATGLSGPAPAPAAEPNKLTDEELADGWLRLFDGETLFGWKAEDGAPWKAADGAITAAEGKVAMLRTTSEFGNCLLKLDCRSARGSSGRLLLRLSPASSINSKGGYPLEVDIADGGNRTQWRSFEVTADGRRLTVKIDGKAVANQANPSPAGRGFVALRQDNGKIEFRNIKLKSLGAKGIFNGKDMTGWKGHPQSKSVGSVTPEGWLNIKKGWGELETEGQYADFTLHMEVLVNSKAANSGIFFRCIPGEMMNGYECQIQNDYNSGDRTKPRDCGTGGIYRRQNARMVVSDDLRWFHLAIHADGNHVATWVDGYQVVDWTDERPPHDNPRNGQRLKSGTIQIQGHDPTTDLSFRKVRIAELPPR